MFCERSHPVRGEGLLRIGELDESAEEVAQLARWQGFWQGRVPSDGTPTWLAPRWLTANRVVSCRERPVPGDCYRVGLHLFSGRGTAHFVCEYAALRFDAHFHCELKVEGELVTRRWTPGSRSLGDIRRLDVPRWVQERRAEARLAGKPLAILCTAGPACQPLLDVTAENLHRKIIGDDRFVTWTILFRVVYELQCSVPLAEQLVYS